MTNYVVLLSTSYKLGDAALYNWQIIWYCSPQPTNYVLLLSTTDKLHGAAFHNWQIMWCCFPQLTNYMVLLSTTDKLRGAALHNWQIMWGCSQPAANYVVLLSACGKLRGVTTGDLSEGSGSTFHLCGRCVGVDGCQVLHCWGQLLLDALNVVLHKQIINTCK